LKGVERGKIVENIEETKTENRINELSDFLDKYDLYVS
jgi:hypothetical protein